MCVQLKDLKRQLQQMQKKEEKLQEQLSELRGAQCEYACGLNRGLHSLLTGYIHSTFRTNDF